MRQSMAAVVICAALAGCSVPSPFQSLVPSLGAPPGNLNVDRQACNRSYPAQPGGYVAHAQCVNDAIERDAIPFARYPDLVRLQEQLRLKYSAQVDRGQISPHQAERKMAEVDNIVNAATQDRDRGHLVAAGHGLDRLQTLLE